MSLVEVVDRHYFILVKEGVESDTDDERDYFENQNTIFSTIGERNKRACIDERLRQLN